MSFHHFMAKYLYVQYIVSIAALDSKYIFQYWFVVNISFKRYQHSIKYDGQPKWVSCKGNFSKKNTNICINNREHMWYKHFLLKKQLSDQPIILPFVHIFDYKFITS